MAGTHVGIDDHALIERGNYNINCPGGGATKLDALQVKDAEIFAGDDDGVHMPGGCANVRLTGDIIENNGQLGTGSGVNFTGSDLSLEGGIIEPMISRD